jgi:polyprenyl P-hydroxybenzoate/phenylacrylic acid decarboxylase-like protein
MRVVVGITGATGAIFGIRILQALRELDVKTEVILSKWARVTIQHDTEFTAPEVEALATEVHSDSNLAASISSGSFKTDGMIIMSSTGCKGSAERTACFRAGMRALGSPLVRTTRNLGRGSQPVPLLKG